MSEGIESYCRRVFQSRDVRQTPKRRSAALSQLPISESDFVVEIGAGPTPFRHTKLIIDKYPVENNERHGDIQNIAPVIKADAAKLPLKDKACEVLFVSHVIEHLDDPARFIEEAKRCSKHIYLEFPTVVRELMYAWSFHKWLVDVEGSRLVFYKNDIPQLFGNFFHAHYDFLLDSWSEYRFEELNASMYLRTNDLAYTITPKTALEYVLERSARGDQKVNFRSQYGQIGLGTVAYPITARLKMLLWTITPAIIVRARNRLARKRNRSMRHELTEAIVARLLCQSCRIGSLRLEHSASKQHIICCISCGERYTSTDGVFDFDL